MFTKDHNLDKIKQYAVNDYHAYAYGNYTVTSSSTDISSIIPTVKPRMMHIYVESDNTTTLCIRYRVDGGAPVATTSGIPRENKDEFFVYEYSNIEKFRVIEEQANTTVLRITFYK